MAGHDRMALFESLEAANRAKSALLVVLFVAFYTLMIFGMFLGALAIVDTALAWRSPGTASTGNTTRSLIPTR